MRAMKDSGIEWLDQIPENWRLERLKFHAKLNPATQLPEYGDTDEVSFIPMDNLKAGYHTVSSNTYRKVKSGYVVFQNGDVLMAKVTPCLENGNIAIADSLKDGVGFGSTEINVLRCFDMNNRYLFYLLQCPTYIHRARYDMFGVAGLKRLDPGFLPNSYFPIPDADEQQRIVEYINRRCSEIDSLISAKEKTNALLREQRQSIIYETVTKGLNPDAPMKDSGVEWIGKIPDCWTTAKVKCTGDFQSGDAITANQIAVEGKYPVYGGNGIRGYTAKYNRTGSHILIGRQGALCGNVHHVDGEFWASEHAVVGTINSNFSVRFMFYVLTAFNLNRLSITAAQPGISVGQIVNVKIPVPSIIDEQNSIAEYLDQRCAQMDSIMEANESTIQKLKEYRQSVIYEAVTGKIEV